MFWLRGVLLLALAVAAVGCGGPEPVESTGGGEPETTSLETTVAGGETTAGSGEATPTVRETTGGGGTTGSASGGIGLPVAEPVGEMAAPGESPEEILAAGAEPTEGLLNEYRMVSYYGHPFTGYMGILGQYEPEEMVGSLKEQATAYTELTPERPAIPTIELISSVAQRSPGPDGDYLTRTPREVIEEYVEVARENNPLLLLDIQIGHSNIATEVQYLFPYLKLPFVHLAIDPEYDMPPGGVPGLRFGSSPAWEIMGAADTLSQMVEEYDLPPKVLVVHQFRDGMIVNKEALEPVEDVQMVVHTDGFGVPYNKFSKYKLLVTEQPVQYGGFKLFYQQDFPLLAPEQVLSTLNPPPAVVSYQ